MEQPKTPSLELVVKAVDASRQVCGHLPAALVAAHVLNELGYRCTDGRYGVCLGPDEESMVGQSVECDLLLVDGQLVDSQGLVHKDRDAVLAHVRITNPAANWEKPWKNKLQDYDPFDPDWLDKNDTVKIPMIVERAVALMEHGQLDADTPPTLPTSRARSRL